MKKQKGRIGFWKRNDGVSIAFSVFVVFTTIIIFAIINLGISPTIQETVKFTNTYNENNPDKYLEEVHRNQADAYRFFDAFSVVMLLSLGAWAVVNAIRRSWDTTGGE